MDNLLPKPANKPWTVYRITHKDNSLFIGYSTQSINDILNQHSKKRSLPTPKAINVIGYAHTRKGANGMKCRMVEIYKVKGFKVFVAANCESNNMLRIVKAHSRL